MLFSRLPIGAYKASSTRNGTMMTECRQSCPNCRSEPRDRAGRLLPLASEAPRGDGSTPPSGLITGRRRRVYQISCDAVQKLAQGSAMPARGPRLLLRGKDDGINHVNDAVGRGDIRRRHGCARDLDALPEINRDVRAFDRFETELFGLGPRNACRVVLSAHDVVGGESRRVASCSLASAAFRRCPSAASRTRRPLARTP